MGLLKIVFGEPELVRGQLGSQFGESVGTPVLGAIEEDLDGGDPVRVLLHVLAEGREVAITL